MVMNYYTPDEINAELARREAARQAAAGATTQPSGASPAPDNPRAGLFASMDQSNPSQEGALGTGAGIDRPEAMDYLRAAGQGAARLARGAGSVMRAAGLDTPGKWLENEAGQDVEAFDKAYSPGWRKTQAEPWSMGNAGRKLLAGATEMAPSFLVMGPAAETVGAGATALGAGATTARTLGAAFGGTAGFGVPASGDLATEIRATTPEKMDANPRLRGIYDSMTDIPEAERLGAARDQLANEAVRGRLGAEAVLNAAMGPIGSKLEGLIGGPTSSKLLNAGKNIAQEAAVGGGFGMGSRGAENIARNTYLGEDHPITEGMLQSAGEGALFGGMMGAGKGTKRATPGEQANRDAQASQTDLARATDIALQDTSVDPATRADAAQKVYERLLQDAPYLAPTWDERAQDAITRGVPIDVHPELRKLVGDALPDTPTTIKPYLDVPQDTSQTTEVQAQAGPGPQAEAPQTPATLNRDQLMTMYNKDLDSRDALYDIADAFGIDKPHRMGPDALVDGILKQQQQKIDATNEQQAISTLNAEYQRGIDEARAQGDAARAAQLEKDSPFPQTIQSADNMPRVAQARQDAVERDRTAGMLADMQQAQAQADQARQDIMTATTEADRAQAIQRFEEATKALGQQPALPQGVDFNLVPHDQRRDVQAAQAEQQAAVDALSQQPALPSGTQDFELVPDSQRRDLPVPSTAIPMGTDNAGLVSPKAAAVNQAIEATQAAQDAFASAKTEADKAQARQDYQAAVDALNQAKALPAGSQDFNLVPDAERNDRLPVKLNESPTMPAQPQTPEAFAQEYGIPATPEFLDAIRMYQGITGEPLSASLNSDVRFKKSLSAQGVPASMVESWLAPVRERLASHINLKVANSPEDIPAADRARLDAQDPNWSRNSTGAATKDGSYILAWNLKGDRSEVRALATHEVKHQAMYRVFERLAEEKPYNGMATQQMARVLNPLIEARRGEIETIMRSQYGRDFNPGNKMHMLVGASEWLADAKNVEPRLYEQFMAAIRSALRAVGDRLDIHWLRDMKMSDAEVKAVNARIMREALQPDVPVHEMSSYEDLSRQAAGAGQQPIDLERPALAASFRRGTATIPMDITQADHNIAFDTKPRFSWDKDGAKKTLSGLYDKFINQDQPWVRYAGIAGPEQAKAMDERTARLRGLGGITNEALSGEGVPTFWKTGQETENSGIKPLSSILEQIKSPAEYKNYEILRKGERMLALAKYRPEFTPERAAEMKAAIADIREMYGDSPTVREIREMKQLIQDTKDYYQNGVKGVDEALWRRNLGTLWAQIGPEAYSRLQKISGEHRQWERDAILKPLMESGVMSREKYDAILTAPENEYYASFQREMDNVDRQVLGTREVVKRLRGSDLATIPSTESTISNFTRTVRAIETNARNKQFVGLREISDDLAHVIQPIKANPEHPPRDALMVYENGVKKYFSAPGDIVKAAQSMTPQETHLAMKILQWPAKALRAGATLTAEFMARNPIRDQMTAGLFSKYGYVPFADFIKGFQHILGNSELYREYRSSGAEQAYFTALDRQFAGKTAKQLMGYGSGKLDKSIKYIKNPIEALRLFNEWGEKATRVGGYAKAREKGATPMQAMQESRDLTLDFGRMGSQGKVLNSIIAFWNANVQDVDKMRRAFKDQPGTTMTRMVMGVTLPSLALWMINKDEDWYKELPEWRKNAFWNFKIGDSPVLSLPKPFLPGILFGSLPERILDHAYLNDKRAIPSAIKDAIGSAMPGFIPTAGLPVLEWMTNHSFFRGTPIENAGAQRLPAGYRANAGTSKTLAEIGKLTDVSPLKMENTIRDVFGGLGGYGLTAADWLTKAATGNGVPEVGKHWYEQAPMVRGFVAREPIGSASKSVDDFYDNHEKAAQARAAFVALRKSGNAEEAKKYLEANKNDISMATTMENGARILSNIRKAITAIQRNTDMPEDEKRKKVDELSRRQTEIASRLNKAYDDRMQN